MWSKDVYILSFKNTKDVCYLCDEGKSMNINGVAHHGRENCKNRYNFCILNCHLGAVSAGYGNDCIISW